MQCRIGLGAALSFCMAFGGFGTQKSWAQASGELKVALTFDDLPETGDHPNEMSRAQIGDAIVKALVEANAPPVYGFVNAGVLDDDEVKGLLERWRKAGFLLGNHTYTHYGIQEKPLRVYEQDIHRNEKTLKKLMVGEDWHWFRYPFLMEGATLERRNAVRKYLADNHYKIAEVTINFEDHAWNDPFARCLNKHDDASIEQMKAMYIAAASESIRVSQVRSHMLFGRDISYVMLLHYGGFEAVMLPRLLDILKDRGFRLVTLPEAESDPVYAKDPGVVNDGGTFLDDLMQASDLDEPVHTDPPEAELAKMCL
jgi:peptidoglycan/xylan/chitin deacetylase (PgdA/CDA1 family)